MHTEFTRTVYKMWSLYDGYVFQDEIKEKQGIRTYVSDDFIVEFDDILNDWWYVNAQIVAEELGLTK